MLQKRWFVWLLILLGLAGLGALVAGLLFAQGMVRTGFVVVAVAAVLVNLWVYVGLWRWRHVGWVRYAAWLIVTGDIVHLLSLIWTRIVFYDQGGYEIAFTHWMPLALSGVWFLIASFVTGLALIRLLLAPGHPVFGVARTLIDEAIRMRVALVLVGVVLIMIPILPFILGTDERLEYRVKTFLTYALSGSSVLLSLKTIFLACWTISNEVRSHQIYMTLTKPVSRAQYLLGKWIGLALLNLLLVTVLGIGVYFFTRIIEQPTRQMAMYDAMQLRERIKVEQEVLVARDAVQPTPVVQAELAQAFEDRMWSLYNENPDQFTGAPYDRSIAADTIRLRNSLTPRQQQDIQGFVISKWHTIPPREGRAFRFEGVAAAADYTDQVQLRFKPSSTPEPPDRKIRLALRVNGNVYPQPIEVVNGNVHILPLPVQLADDKGGMTIEIANVNPLNPDATHNASVTFPPGEGLEVLYRVGGFEGNLVRALGVIWLRLIYLAMLGLAAGTFLGFPVACLVCLFIYAIAIMSGFLTEAMGYFSPLDTKSLTWWDTILLPFRNFFGFLSEGKVWEALKVPIRLFGDLAVALTPSFSAYNPVPMVAGGRRVPNDMLTQATLWVGLIWTGVCALVAWLIFKFKELATVTV